MLVYALVFAYGLFAGAFMHGAEIQRRVDGDSRAWIPLVVLVGLLWPLVTLYLWIARVGWEFDLGHEPIDNPPRRNPFTQNNK